MRARKHFGLTLGPRDKARVEQAKEALRRVPSGGPSEAVFKAIRLCTPVVGGLIGRIGNGRDESLISHAVSLPNEILEGWWSAPREQIGLMLSPLLTAMPGQLISDSQAIVGQAREQFALLSLLRAHGLGEAAGYKVGGKRGSGFLFMTFALEKGRAFAKQDHTLLYVLQDEIRAALLRIALPLVASQPLMAQIVEDRSMGFLCVNAAGQCIEWNEKGRQLCSKYHAAASVAPGRDLLSRFAERIRQRTSENESKSFSLWHEARCDLLEIHRHHLAKETHSIGQDVVLITLEEKKGEKRITSKDLKLTAREAEIAHWLVQSDLAQWAIAEKLDISEGTLRAHLAHIYKKAKVKSRMQLITRLKENQQSPS